MSLGTFLQDESASRAGLAPDDLLTNAYRFWLMGGRDGGHALAR